MSNSKSKGHKQTGTTIKCHVPFYSKPFFDPAGEMEDGEVKQSKIPMVKIPIKIAANGDESRANVTTFELRGITHFDNNVENVLETFMQLNERVVKPKNMEDKNKEFKSILKLLHLLCSTGPATQTLQEATRMARTQIVEQYLLINHRSAEGLGENLKEDETLFHNFIEQTFEDLDQEVFPNPELYNCLLFEEYKRAFWNYLHSIIFGADAFCAFKQQKEYMLHQLVKPFGATVELSFRRIEVMASLMEYFPPPCSRGKQPTRAQWTNFNGIKKLTPAEKREIKYNLLPPFFHEKMEDLGENWDETTEVKFMAEAQKCKIADKRERRKAGERKEKEKSKRKRNDSTKDDDSVSSLSRSQASANGKSKRRRGNGKANGQGEARVCELCKLACAPDFVYKSHYTNQCKKKDQYAKQMSGGAGQRKTTVKEYKSMEKKLSKELKMVRKKLAKKKKVDSDDSDSEMSSGSE